MAEAGVNVQRFKMADTEAEGVEAGSHLMGTVAKELVIKVNYVNRKVHVESYFCFCITVLSLERDPPLKTAPPLFFLSALQQ